MSAPMDQSRKAIRPQSLGVLASVTTTVVAWVTGAVAAVSIGSTAAAIGVATGDVTVSSIAGAASTGGRTATRQLGSDAESRGIASIDAMATSHTRWRAAAEERRQPYAAAPARRSRGAPRSAAEKMASIQGSDHS